MTTALVGMAVLFAASPANAAQSRANCTPTAVQCSKNVLLTGTTSVAAPAAVAGVPPTLFAHFSESVRYPSIGVFNIPKTNKVNIAMQSSGGVNGVPAHLCAASQENTKFSVEHTLDFQAGPLAVGFGIGPVNAGFVTGPRSMKVVTGDLQGCSVYYNVDLDITIPPGMLGVTHTMVVTSKLAGGSVTTAAISEWIPFDLF